MNFERLIFKGIRGATDEIRIEKISVQMLYSLNPESLLYKRISEVVLNDQ